VPSVVTTFSGSALQSSEPLTFSVSSTKEPLQTKVAKRPPLLGPGLKSIPMCRRGGKRRRRGWPVVPWGSISHLRPRSRRRAPSAYDNRIAVPRDRPTSVAKGASLRPRSGRIGRPARPSRPACPLRLLPLSATLTRAPATRGQPLGIMSTPAQPLVLPGRRRGDSVKQPGLRRRPGSTPQPRLGGPVSFRLAGTPAQVRASAFAQVP